MIHRSLVCAARIVMRHRYRLLAARADQIARPDDAERASIPAPVSHRVLIVGNEYAVAWGVRTHALALPGQLARQIALRTGLGVDVDVVATPGMSITDLADAIDDRDLGGYDTVVVLTGAGDAFRLLAPGSWDRHLRQLMTELLTRTAPSTPITLVGIETVSSLNITRTRQDGIADRWAHHLDEVTTAVASEYERVHVLPAPIVPTAILDDVDRLRFKSPTVYKAWAVAIARHVVPLLVAPLTTTAQADDAPPSAAGPLEVRRRLSALNDLAILHSAPETRFTVIVRRARDLFCTEGAMFSLITDTHQWNKAMVGFHRTEIPLHESFCAITIRSAGPFVVEDAWSDPRITFDTVIRFYAGCPVTAPDGTRVGALCVFDANPREAVTIQTAYLEELAQLIGDELARARPGAGSAA